MLGVIKRCSAGTTVAYLAEARMANADRHSATLGFGNLGALVELAAFVGFAENVGWIGQIWRIGHVVEAG